MARVEWFEFLFVGIVIVIPIGIAVYFSRKGHKTVSEYFLGNKQMSPWAIALSHSSAFIAPTMVVALPADIYAYGSPSSWAVASVLAMGLTQSYIFLPVFYNLQLVSLYEYCELRFNKRVRDVVSAINALYELLLSAIEAYVLSIVLGQFLGISETVSTTCLMFVCITYTTLGGFKGVIYADVFQFGVIFVNLMVMNWLWYSSVGGWNAFYNEISQSDHLDFFEWRLDVRQSFWSAFFGLYLIRSMEMSGSASYQRAISLPTMELAQKVNVVYSVIGTAFLFLQYIGALALFVFYRGCDPVTAKILTKFDQLVPHFILTQGATRRGVKGIFLAGITSASLSTMATLLNNSAGVVNRDFVQRFLKDQQSDKMTRRSIKVLCVALGLISWLVALALKKSGSIFQLFMAFSGLTSGAVFAIFILGLFAPRVGAKSVLCATYPWVVIAVGLCLAQVIFPRPVYPTKHMSVASCPSNITSFRNTSAPIDPAVWSSVNPVYRISSSYNGMIAFGFVFILSVGLSFFFKENKVPEERLLSPLIRSPTTTRQQLRANNEIPLLSMNKRNEL